MQCFFHVSLYTSWSSSMCILLKAGICWTIGHCSKKKSFLSKPGAFRLCQTRIKFSSSSPFFCFFETRSHCSPWLASASWVQILKGWLALFILEDEGTGLSPQHSQHILPKSPATSTQGDRKQNVVEGTNLKRKLLLGKRHPRTLSSTANIPYKLQSVLESQGGRVSPSQVQVSFWDSI